MLGALFLAVSAAAAEGVIRGQLVAPVDGEPLTLAVADGTQVRLVLDEGLDLTMRDPQLADRSWELRGTKHEDGSFEAVKIFTVKDGELYRVTYYCEICHITTHQPGPCMCCQGVTDLKEIEGE